MGASVSFDPQNEDDVKFLSEQNEKWNNQDTIRIPQWRINKSWNNYPVLKESCVSVRIAGFGGAGLGTFGQNLKVVSVTDNFIIAEHDKGNIYRLDIDKKCGSPLRTQDWIDTKIQSYFISIIPEEFKGIYNYFWNRQPLINISSRNRKKNRNRSGDKRSSSGINITIGNSENDRKKRKNKQQDGGAYENYNYVINPIDNKKYKTNSIKGKSIIQIYAKQLKAYN